MRDRLERFRAVRAKKTPLVVDPAGCGCTDCLLSESFPADTLTEEQKDQVADDDNVIDRTGYTELEWGAYLR